MRPFHAVTVRFGPPVSYWHDGEKVTTGQCPPARRRPDGPEVDGSSAQANELEQAELRDLTDALMTEIARLSGQEYVDRYASRARPA